MSLNDVAQTLGWVGAFLLTLGYWLVSTRRVEAEGLAFQLLNIVGSALLGIAAAGGRVWASVALNSLWTAIGISIVVRLLVRRSAAAAGPVPPTPPGEPPAG